VVVPWVVGRKQECVQERRGREDHRSLTSRSHRMRNQIKDQQKFTLKAKGYKQIKDKKKKKKTKLQQQGTRDFLLHRSTGYKQKLNYSKNTKIQRPKKYKADQRVSKNKKEETKSIASNQPNKNTSIQPTKNGRFRPSQI
jgi:hypothetical protein